MNRASQYERIMGAQRKMAPGTFGGQSVVATPAGEGPVGRVTSPGCVPGLPDGTPDIVYDFGSTGDSTFYNLTQVLAHGSDLLVTGDTPTLLLSGGVTSTWSSQNAYVQAGSPGDGSLLSATSGPAVKRFTASSVTNPWSDVVTFGSSIQYVAVAPDGIVWATTDQRTIYKFSSAGALLRVYNDAASSSILPDGPEGLAFSGGLIYLASFDGIWVADPADEYDAGGGDWRLPFTALYTASFVKPGIAVHGGVVYVSSRNAREILTVPVGGGSIATAYTGNAPDDTSGFYPWCLTVIGGFLYVASGDYRIYRWRVCG